MKLRKRALPMSGRTVDGLVAPVIGFMAVLVTEWLLSRGGLRRAEVAVIDATVFVCTMIIGRMAWLRLKGLRHNDIQVGGPPNAPNSALTSKEGTFGDTDGKFDLILQDAGAQRGPVLRCIMRIADLRLGKAADIVIQAPSTLLTQVSADVAEAARSALSEIGATVIVKPSPGAEDSSLFISISVSVLSLFATGLS